MKHPVIWKKGTYPNPVACKGEASRPLACLFDFSSLFLLKWDISWNAAVTSQRHKWSHDSTPLWAAFTNWKFRSGSESRFAFASFCFLLTGLSVVGFCMLGAWNYFGRGFVASLSAPAVLGVSFIQLDIRRITWPKVQLNLRLHWMRFTCWLACSQMTRTVVTSLSTDKKMWFGVSC